MKKILAIVKSRASKRPLVVSSAHKGMTDALLAGAREAARGVYAPEAVIEKQAAIARDLGCDASLQGVFGCYWHKNTLDRRTLGPYALELCRTMTQRLMKYRDNHPEKAAQFLGS